MGGPWSNLPADLLNVIEDHLALYIDKVRIRAVSMTWNSYLPKLPNNRIIPWLFHPLIHDNPEGATHGLLNPIDNKVYQIYLPEARGKVFKGSSHGWLVTVEDRDSPSPTDICLLNPLTRSRIMLPQRTKFADVVQYKSPRDEEIIILRTDFDVPPDIASGSIYSGGMIEREMSVYYMCTSSTMKVVMSSDPSRDDDCVVVAVYGIADQLAWCRCNEEKWTHIYAGINSIIDIIFHEGKLYAITYTHNMFVLENIGKSNLDIKVTQLASTVPVPRGMSSYLAVSSEDDGVGLILVTRYFDFDRKPKFRTVGFKVYRFDSLNSSWIELENINGKIIFLGANSAKLISSSHAGLPGGYKGNHIYFMDHNGFSDDPHRNESTDSDMGVFSLENGTLESFPGLHQPMWPRPIWINVS